MLKLILFFILLQNQPNEKTPETKTPEINTKTKTKETKIPTKTIDGNSNSLESAKTDTSVSGKTPEKEKLILLKGFPTFKELSFKCAKTSSQIYNTIECKLIREVNKRYSICLRHSTSSGCGFIMASIEVFNFFDKYSECRKVSESKSDCKNITKDNYTENLKKLKKICNKRVFALNYTGECISIFTNKESYISDCNDRASIMYYLKFCKNYREKRTKNVYTAATSYGNHGNKKQDNFNSDNQPVKVEQIASDKQQSDVRRKISFMGSFKLGMDEIDLNNGESQSGNSFGLSASLGYFAGKNFVISLLFSIQYSESGEEKNSSTMFGAGLIYQLENFYAGILFGSGGLTLNDDSISYMFISFPIGVLLKLVDHVYFDIGFRITNMFADDNVNIFALELGWMGFQIIF
ncbi:porin family protein [Myxococcota bacterium]|nr:porin family protein [Myxococcota bacterium]MBU1379519.1 porin family protein [Myxococcota bacterium]MBU1498181.1 porin family protein [Myxococcota bacterium]